MHILTASERFCALFGFAFPINVIYTSTVYSVKEREMSTYSRSTIKSNPLLETYRVALLFMGITAALALLLTVLTVIEIVVEGHATHAVNALTIDLPVFVLALVSLSLHYRHLKRIERRRLAAAEGDHALLSEEQPTPGAAALALPAAFKVSMSKVQMVFLTALLELVIVVFSVYGWFIIAGLPFWLFLMGGTVQVLILVPLVFATSRQVLEVTEVGLRLRASRASGFRGMVRWNEAHLFAVYNAPGVRRSGAVLTYELSSASSIVRWTRILRPNSLGLHMDPGMPLAEHNQAMKALCQLIAAQTGLPLYDLRKERTWEAREGVTDPRFERPPAQ